MKRITLYTVTHRGWSSHRGAVALPVGLYSVIEGRINELFDLGGQF